MGWHPACWHCCCLLRPAAPQVKAFEEDVLSLALHPTGYLLLAGCADKLRLMTVLAGGWRTPDGSGGQDGGCG